MFRQELQFRSESSSSQALEVVPAAGTKHGNVRHAESSNADIEFINSLDMPQMPIHMELP